MVGSSLTNIEEGCTSTYFVPTSDGTETAPSYVYSYFQTATTSTDFHSHWQKEEEERKKAEQRARQILKMRSFWKDDIRRLEFRHRKWSWDKPAERQKQIPGGDAPWRRQSGRRARHRTSRLTA